MHKKNILIFLPLFYILCIIAGEYNYSQPAISWTQRYNGLLDSIDIAKDITVDNSGNSYVAGFTNGMLGFSADYIIIKYEVSSGNEIWVKTYDGGILGNDRVTSIAVD